MHVSALAVLGDRRVVSGTADGAVQVWDAHSGEQIAAFLGDAGITSVTTNGDDMILAGSDNGAVHILELRE